MNEQEALLVGLSVGGGKHVGKVVGNSIVHVNDK